MRHRRLVAFALALAGLSSGIAPSAHAQDTREAAYSRLEGRLDAATYAAIVALADSARAAGLPTEPLVQKALQGAARGAPGAQIVAAVQRLAGDFMIARGGLGAMASAAELEAGAGAVRAGVSPQDLGRLRAARPEQPLTVALGTLADLVAHGVPVDTAVAVIRTLVARGARDDEFVELRRRVSATPAADRPGGGGAGGGGGPATPGSAGAGNSGGRGAGRGVGQGATPPGAAVPRPHPGRGNPDRPKPKDEKPPKPPKNPNGRPAAAAGSST